MRVLVAGAHGKVARRLTRMLVAEGHEVRGLVRKQDQLADVGADGTEPVLVDLEKEGVEGTLGDVVAGCDAVVFAAGAGAGSGDTRKASMDHGGAVKLVEAAEERGVRRYVMLSGMGVDDPAAVPETLRPYARAKARADERLRRGGLDWTVVRPGPLTEDEGTGRITAAPLLGRWGEWSEIPREDVAAVLAAVLETEGTVGKTFDVLSGDVLIGEALRRLPAARPGER